MILINLLPYISIFLISNFFLKKKLVFGNNSTRSYNIFFLVVILCTFAGMRSINVGTDTIHYINKYVQAISYNSLNTYVKEIYNGRDYLFAIMTFLVAKITGANQFIYLFLCQLFAIWPLVLAMKKMKTYVPLNAAFIFYYVLYFPIGFNTIREVIAGSFLILALMYYYSAEYKKCIVMAIIAQLFHHATILAIVVMVIVEAIIIIKNKKIRRVIITLTIAVIIICAINYTTVLRYLFADGSLFSGTKIASYYNRYTSGTLKTYLVTMDKYGQREIIFREIFFILTLGLSKNIDVKYLGLTGQKDYYFTKRFRIYSIVSILIYTIIFFGTSSTYGYRITYIIDLINIFYYGHILMRSKSQIKYVLLILLVAYYYLIYIQIRAHGIFPYHIA